MNPWWQGLLDGTVDRWGCTLVHSIWQGAVAAAGFALLRPILRRHSAQTRYWVACGMLAAIAAGLVLTFLTCPTGQPWQSGPASAPHLGIGVIVSRLATDSLPCLN
jgi:hypothetical protein